MTVPAKEKVLSPITWQTDQKSVTAVKLADNEGANQPPYNFDSDVTFQLPEPAEVVKTRAGDPVYVMLKREFTVQQNPEVTNNITRLNVHQVDCKSAISRR